MAGEDVLSCIYRSDGADTIVNRSQHTSRGALPSFVHDAEQSIELLSRRDVGGRSVRLPMRSGRFRFGAQCRKLAEAV